MDLLFELLSKTIIQHVFPTYNSLSLYSSSSIEATIASTADSETCRSRKFFTQLSLTRSTMMRSTSSVERGLHSRATSCASFRSANSGHSDTDSFQSLESDGGSAGWEGPDSSYDREPTSPMQDSRRSARSMSLGSL